MTKTHLIIIAAIALVLLVIFGHGNPYEKYKRRQQMRQQQSLVTKIMKHVDPSYGKKSKNPIEKHNGIEDGIDTSADKDNTEMVNGPAPGVRASRRLQPGQGRAGGVVGVDGAPGNSYNNYQDQNQGQSYQTQPRPTGGAVETTSGNYLNNYNNTVNRAAPAQAGGSDPNYYPPTGSGAQGGNYRGAGGPQGYPVRQNYGNGNPNAGQGSAPSGNDYYPPTQ